MRLSSHAASVVLGSLLACSLSGCCHYPKAAVKQLSGIQPSGTVITLVAYGDTRTGPWGLGDNKKLGIHGKVVDDIFQNDASIDAVLFTGDAVMSNFILWKKGYWRCFLKVTNRFHDSGIPFYPTLGNHEVLPEIVPLLIKEPKGYAMLQKSEPDKNKQVARAKAYEDGEEPKLAPQEFQTELQAAPTGNANTNEGRAELKQLMKALSQKENTEAANRLGQFERQTQKAFYSQSRDTRCGSDSGTFKDDYLTIAKYTYLAPLL